MDSGPARKSAHPGMTKVFRQRDVYHFHARAVYQRFRCHRATSSQSLRVVRGHHGLTPSQPKPDITKNGRIALNVRVDRVCVALRCVREFVDVCIA
jgi:hypothetical protein